MNCYADLTTIKRRLAIASVTTWDTDLLALLNTASRAIDGHCKRQFFAETATKYFDGAKRMILLPDLLSVTTLKVDADCDGTFEDSYTTDTDYVLEPYSKFPKTRLSISSRVSRNFSDFGAGKKIVEIVGLWGYGTGLTATPYAASTTTTAEELDASETGVDVASGAALAIGQTILVESEQMYISGISTNTLTVVRGVNGTTAATHATGKTVYIYEYPSQVNEACIMQTGEWFKILQSGYTGVIGGGEFGPQMIRKGLDPNVKLLLREFVNWEFS